MAIPVTFEPGSSLSWCSWVTESSRRRSFKMIVKGCILNTAARCFLSSSLALAGWQGSRGFLFESRTKTKDYSLSPFRDNVYLDNVLRACYVQDTGLTPLNLFNLGRQSYRLVSIRRCHDPKNVGLKDLSLVTLTFVSSLTNSRP